MTSDEFGRRIIEMQETLYRVSYGILCKPCDREDAVQECIRKAWQEQKALWDDALFKQWVLRILVNECFTILRHYRCVVPSDILPENTYVAPPDADHTLHDCIMALDLSLRVPVILHYVEGYNIEEIAQMLRFHRARKQLKSALLPEEA